MTTPAPVHPRRRYRRGEGERLREDILTAARELLTETGSQEAVSIRAVAERVGVSTPSIYLHFQDKDALISAVCSAVFADLDRVMNEAAAGEPDPFEALRARGMAYARFALDNPEHYRIVMMIPRPPSDDDFAMDDAMASTTFSNLVAAVKACTDAGFFTPEQDPEQIAVTLWAAVHGAVSLVIAKQHFTSEDGMALCDTVISASGLGSAVMGRLPEDPALAHRAVGEALAGLPGRDG